LTVPANGGIPVERLRISETGNVGIGTSSPSQSLQVTGAIASTGQAPALTSSSTFFDYIAALNTARFAAVGNTTGTAAPIYFSQYSSNGSVGRDAVAIDSSGRLGIGTTSPAYKLDVTGGGIGVNTSGGTAASVVFNQTGVGVAEVGVPASENALTFKTWTGAALVERARIDSSGRLLVGTSTAQGDYTLQIQGDAVSANAAGCIYLRRGLNTAAIGANVGADLGKIQFGANDGTVAARIQCLSDATWGSTSDTPGALVFSTTTDGASSPTERMRITNAGLHYFMADGNDTTRIQNTAAAGTATSFLAAYHSSTAGTVNTGTLSLNITTNGNITNTNNSYGALSDIKLKENIVDANSQWSDIKALQVRNYNFKEGQTHTQIGLIAQEVELVSPGLVSESPDRDEDGNDLGTVTKSVNYSVLYMKAVKALQEAMERIETLEAKVAALEA